MANLDFIKTFPYGNATITVQLPDSTVERIDNVSPTAIAEKCPLLRYAFDDGPNGNLQATIEASSTDLVIAFLRYLYTDAYLSPGEEHVPCSLLRHAEMFKMAQTFDIPELQVLSYLGFLRETEFSISKPEPPIHLCEAIRFVYKHLADQHALTDTLLNYCAYSFGYHALATNPDFLHVSQDVPDFQRALCHINFKRDFQDDGAADIVRLADTCQNPNPQSFADKRTHAEFQYTEWYDSEVVLDSEQGSMQDAKHSAGEPTGKRRKTITEGDFTIVHRPKHTVQLDGENTSRDEDGFTVVHRPKPVLASDVGSGPEDAWTTYDNIKPDPDEDAWTTYDNLKPDPEEDAWTAYDNIKPEPDEDAWTSYDATKAKATKADPESPVACNVPSSPEIIHTPSDDESDSEWSVVYDFDPTGARRSPKSQF